MLQKCNTKYMKVLKRQARAVSLLCLLISSVARADADSLYGVLESAGGPVVGALVSLQSGDPIHRYTVYTDEGGRFSFPPVSSKALFSFRARRIGWKEVRREGVAASNTPLTVRMQRETDPKKVADQLPANRWYQLVLDRMENADQKEELKRQCTYCHQQGSRHTRIRRDPEEWHKVLILMGRMGGLLSADLRAKIPELFNGAYAPEYAIPRLTHNMNSPQFASPPPKSVRRALIEEWELGGRASMQHDMLIHPDGRAYSVDMTQDQLYRMDPSAPDGARKSWQIPNDGLPLNGAFASAGPPAVPTSNAHVGPHSLQVAPDGSIWITLAFGNRLARFDPKKEKWSIHKLAAGFYPHTLRFDPRGRIWFTLAASNHLGMFDPTTGEERIIRLPASTWQQAITLRMLPVFLWVGRYIDIRDRAAQSDGFSMPIPYGVDIAPDGAAWFSQLNEHRIGRVDPNTFEVEMIDTPFAAPRRMRFDAQGNLWIPSFSESLISRFNLTTREFHSWRLPMQAAEAETPYALHVDRKRNIVWVCGTNSDSLIRFDPSREEFRVYPLPTRVTYTREIDFDEQGRVWTSNSNVPTWQIEGGFPSLLRLDPDFFADR